ncbi:ABC transporter permease [[Clostridium] scindens]|uniref:ABC transporter permease n=1 Tax=Clostridium scindens (strain JCM 10418 / VPI 12708) TaxID=29347 RepID=UPI0022E3748D|nr:ABC transporter permease [[Clostridium] scindens]
MKKYILKRLLELIPVLILVSIFSFFIIQASPGDPIDNYVRPGMTEEQIEDIKEEYELEGSMAQQYFRWMSHIMRGDLGTSIHQNRPVVDIIAERLPATLMLMGTALAFSLMIAIPLGLWAGLRKNKRSDNIISLISYLGISIPPFWLAMIGIILFSLKLHLLPSGGMHTVNVNTAADLLWHMILPAFVLSLNNMAIFTRYIRSNTISQLEEDYVQTAMAKGTGKRKILFRHVLKNCLLPIITLAGINIAGLVCGSFVVETIFSWPGIGRLAMDAVGNRDFPLIMGYTMFSCIILILGNLIADVLYAVADPRIRQGMGRDNG